MSNVDHLGKGTLPISHGAARNTGSVPRFPPDFPRNILALKNEVDGQIVSLGRKAENARNLLLRLYQKPVVNTAAVSKLLDLTPTAANALIKDMENLGILKEMTGFRRNRLFMFEKYMHLF